MKGETMKIDDIMELIKGLAKSQGMYGRLYETLIEMQEDDPEEWEGLVQELEAKAFKDPLDFIMWYEGGM